MFLLNTTTLLDFKSDSLSKESSHLFQTKLKNLNGKIKATTDGINAVKKSDIIVICVPTPLDENFRPDLSYVKSAAETISKGLKKGKLIIVE